MKKKVFKHITIYICILLTVTGLLYCIYQYFFNPYRGVPDKIGISLDLHTILSKEQALEDLDYIIEKLTERHPTCMDGLPEPVLKLYQKEKENLSERVSVLELWQAASRILAAMKDGHTRTLYYPAKYYTLPVTFDFMDGKLTCTGTYDNKEISNVTVTEIGGFPVQKLYDTFLEQFSYELESYASYIFAKYLNRDIYLEFVGVDTSSDIELTFEMDGKKETVILPFMENPVVQTYEEEPFVSYEIDEKSSIGIFTLKHCTYNEVYKDTLKSFFKEVKDNNINSLIIDLRYNGGGNSMVANEFMRYLNVDKYNSGTSHVRFGPYLLKNKMKPVTNKKYDSLTFEGQIYVLTSTTTFSSAMDFAAIISDNKLGVVIGEIPGNMPSSYGDILQFQAPNSKLSFSISYKYFIRPDETKNSEPLIPDYEIPAEDALNKAKELIILKS